MARRTWWGMMKTKDPAPAGERPADVPALTIRYAVDHDAEALSRLAELDSSRPPRGVVIVAEVGGELWAAISLDDHHAIADPFRPTAELVWILLERSRSLRRANRGRMEALPRVWPSLRDDLAGLAG